MNTDITKSNLIVVGGPTASGKTDIAIQIAKKLNGILINADSVQIYKYLNIGSNKGLITKGKEICLGDWKINEFEIENSGVTGLLFDIVEPDYNFTVAHYQTLAYQAIDYAKSLGKMPILVGGTGLYIDAVIKGYAFEEEEIDEKLRKELEAWNTERLQSKLCEISKETFEQLNESDKHNPRRLIRLIEKIIKAKPVQNLKRKELEHLFIYPEFDNEDLMRKIDRRVDWMFENGLIEEVQGLLDKGYSPEYKSMQSTGYKEVIKMLLNKDYSYEQCKADVKQAHKKYAKRQITWFEGENRGYKLFPLSTFSSFFITFAMISSILF